jgi:transposase
MVILGEVLLAHRRQPYRRFSAAEKIAHVEKCHKTGISVSAVARRYDVSSSQLFSWRKLMTDGEMKAVETKQEVVPLSEVKALKAKICELEQSLRKKTHQNEILKDLPEIAKEKKIISPSFIYSESWTKT